MLIYGNTPRDIMRIMRNRKWRTLGVIVMIILIGLAFTGCTIGNKKISPPLQALDKFWDTLGSGEDKTKKDSAEVE
jgi:sulfite exporter TauE/SafE